MKIINYKLAIVVLAVLLSSCAGDIELEDANNDLSIPAQIRAASILKSFTLDADVNIRIQTDNNFNFTSPRVGLEIFTIFTDNHGEPVTTGSLNLSTFGEIPVGLYGDVGYSVNTSLPKVDLTDDQYEELTYKSQHPDLGDFSRKVFLESEFVVHTNVKSGSLPGGGKEDITMTWAPSTKEDQRVIVGVARPDYSYEVFEAADIAGKITIPVSVFNGYIGSGETGMIAIVRGYEDCFESSNGEKVCVLSYGTSYRPITL